MRVWTCAAILIVGAGLAGCEAPRQAEVFGSTPASVAVCSYYVGDSFARAQQHCQANGGKNAELVNSGRCQFSNGPGADHQFMTGMYPFLSNFRCVQ